MSKITLNCNLQSVNTSVDGQISLTLGVNSNDKTFADKLFNEIKTAENKGKNGLKVEIDTFREKRSLNANNYSWKLQDEIAKVNKLSIDEVHDLMVLRYGVTETYSMLKEAFESAKRIFEYYKVLGESSLNGQQFIHVRAGIGTHNYNTAEMSRFIDGVVGEAQQLEIETLTPNELAEIKSLWGKGI